jgi:hypothetical protein
MDDQVQRMVEGADRDHDADGLVRGEGDPAQRGRRDAHGHDAATLRPQEFGGVQDAVDSARHLSLGVSQRLAAFARRLNRQVFGPVGHQACGPAQDLRPLGSRQPAVAVAEQAVGGFQRRFDGIGAAGLDGVDQPCAGGA